ncbi:MAG: two-component sensor histidine kinase [Ramlibacter sp.]|nr:two-component sensor histidine kinase [Ramlibacter sp.]
MNRSITLRLVGFFGVATLSTFALISMVLYGVLQRETERHERDQLESRMSNVEYSVARAATPEHWDRVVLPKLDALQPSDGSARLWILSADPRYRYGDPPAAAGSDGLGTQAPQPGGRRLATLTRTMPALGERPEVRIVVGVDPSSNEQTLETFGHALAMLSVSALLLIVLMGWWIARIGLRPLKCLSQDAQALRPRNLSQRLPAAQLPGELRDLAEAFNGALDRLEAAYTQLEAFNADVAHELRTPLTNLIGGTEVALARPRTALELHEALQSNLEELVQLRSIVNDMLFLARADQGDAAIGLVQVSVAQEVARMIEFFDAIFEDKGVSVGVEGDLQARAAINIALFRRALSNLLQNAVQHSPPGARLAVRIARQDSSVWIRVVNTGATIPSEHLPRLFDRFYRVDAARRDAGGVRGHGLGLAIVKAVASMHGGGVAAASGDGVTTIAFSVPAVAA